jgi:hypothetical protein
VLAGCAPAARPRPPLKEVCAPVPPCPSWLDVFRDRPATLQVHLVDRFSPDCEPSVAVTATASFDGAEIGNATLTCGAPGRIVHLEGPKVSPGLHELVVRTTGPAGTLEASAVVSLPAFDVAGDGKTATLGAEMIVDVGVEDLSIEPPAVYPPHDL